MATTQLQIPTDDLNNSYSKRLSPSPTSDNMRNLSKLLEDAENFKLAFREGLQDTQQDLIKQMLEETQFFNIGQIKFPFNPQDPIFYRDSKIPENQRQESPYCLACHAKLKNSKQHHFWQNNCQHISDFCGAETCKLCMLKTKPFPEHNYGQKNRGDICKVCDRKFFIKEMLKESLETIDTQNQVLESLKEQAKEKEDECANLESDFKSFADNIQEQLQRVNQIKKDEKKQIKKLLRENKFLSTECSELITKKNQIEDSQVENKQSIDQIKEEINLIDENVLRVKLKIREVELERERLEEQILNEGMIEKQRNKIVPKIENRKSNQLSSLMASCDTKDYDKGQSLIQYQPDQDLEGYSNFNELLQTEDINMIKSNRSTTQFSEYKKRDKKENENSITTIQGDPQNSCCNNTKCEIF